MPRPARDRDQVAERTPRPPRRRRTRRRARSPIRGSGGVPLRCRANRPPSQCARQVTMTGVRRPCKRSGDVGRSTRSSRSSTRSASTAASRLRRRSSIVGPATVTHSCGSFIGVVSSGKSPDPQKRKSPLSTGLRRLCEILYPAVGRLADGPLSARVPPPIGRLRPTVPARAAKESHREERTIAPFSLTCNQLLLITVESVPVSPTDS